MAEDAPNEIEPLDLTATAIGKSGYDEAQHQRNTERIVEHLLSIYKMPQKKRLNQNLANIAERALETQALLRQLQSSSPLDSFLKKLKQSIIGQLARAPSKRAKLEFLGRICGIFDVQLAKDEIEAIIGEEIYARDDIEVSRLDGEALQRGVEDLKTIFAECNIENLQQLISCTNWRERMQIAKAYGNSFSADLQAAFDNQYLYTLFCDKYEALAGLLGKNAKNPQIITLILLLNDNIDRRIILEAYRLSSGRALSEVVKDENATDKGDFIKSTLNMLLSEVDEEPFFSDWKVFFTQILAQEPDLQVVADAIVHGDDELYCACCGQLQSSGGTTMEDFFVQHLQKTDLLLAKCLHVRHYGIDNLMQVFADYMDQFKGCEFAISAFFQQNAFPFREQLSSCQNDDELYINAVQCCFHLFKPHSNVLELPVVEAQQEQQEDINPQQRQDEDNQQIAEKSQEDKAEDALQQ